MDKKTKDGIADIELEKKFQAIHSDLEKNLPKELIFHYTDYNGLKNIIKQRKLRFVDYRYFNDPTELKYGANIIIEALLKYASTRHIINSLKQKIFDKLNEHYQIYIACFSEEIKKLALWRYFASNGAGFAIGFNGNFCKVEDVSLEDFPRTAVI